MTFYLVEFLTKRGVERKCRVFLECFCFDVPAIAMFESEAIAVEVAGQYARDEKCPTRVVTIGDGAGRAG